MQPRFQHQKKIISKDPKRRGLFLGTGSSKTRIALDLSQGKTLVVCTKTLRDKQHWEKENKKWECDLDLIVMSKENFKKKWKEEPEWFLPFDTIIGDEAHLLAGVQPSTFQRNYIKYPKVSQLHRDFVDMVVKIKPERVYLLTATPTSQPMAVWGLATILGYKWDFFQFRDTFYFEKSRNIFFKKRGARKKRKLAECVNHIGEVGRLQDFFDVPAQTYKNHYVESTIMQRQLLSELQLLYPDPLVQLGKRHQLEQGIYEREMVPENKTKAIKQYLEEFDKVVIYARYTKQIERLAKNLRQGTQHKVFVMTGGTNNRGDILEAVEKAERCVFIVQAQISEGYELPSFPCMIFASEFSFVHRRQAEGRILRSNALKKNLYVTLLCGHADSRMRQAVETGEEFDDEVHALNISKQKNI